MYGLPKSVCVCCACDPNERLSAPSICFVYVFVVIIIKYIYNIYNCSGL